LWLLSAAVPAAYTVMVCAPLKFAVGAQLFRGVMAAFVERETLPDD
jgi:hypothetical protein